MKPLALIYDGGLSSHARKHIDQLELMRLINAWDSLDILAEDVRDLNRVDPYYPVLLLYLADGYIQAERFQAGQNCCLEALRWLQSRPTAANQQNGAVAVLYWGLTFHFMGHVGDALHAYEDACSEFRGAALEWNRAGAGNPHAMRCADAPNQLEKCAKQVVLSILLGRGSSNWYLQTIPSPPAASPPTMQVAHSAAGPELVIVGVLTPVLLLVLGWVAHAAGGTIALIVYSAALVSLVVSMQLILKTARKAGLLVIIPEKTVGIIEEQAGTLNAIKPVRHLLLAPWKERLRAVMPDGDQDLGCILERLKARVGNDPSTGGELSLYVTIHVRYRVTDPVAAVRFLDSRPTAGRGSPGILREKDLTRTFEAELGRDLPPLLVSQLGGSTEADRSRYRKEITDNLANGLGWKSCARGISVQELSILAVE